MPGKGSGGWGREADLRELETGSWQLRMEITVGRKDPSGRVERS